MYGGFAALGLSRLAKRPCHVTYTPGSVLWNHLSCLAVTCKFLARYLTLGWLRQRVFLRLLHLRCRPFHPPLVQDDLDIHGDSSLLPSLGLPRMAVSH